MKDDAIRSVMIIGAYRSVDGLKSYAGMTVFSSIKPGARCPKTEPRDCLIWSTESTELSTVNRRPAR